VAKSELLEKIRDAFLAGAWPEEGNKCAQINAFCDFAANWLAEKGIQGVGMQASGLALRFADGSQLGLVEQDPRPYSADTPSIGINAPQRIDPRAVLGDSPSVGITGQ
jgi:hypothetical protein